MKNHKYMILLIYFQFVPVLSAETLGRLFLTPAERSQLEILRVQRDRRLPAAADVEKTSVATVPASPGVVTYNGVVRRSDGTATVWINGKPVNERSKGKNDSEVSVLGLRRDGAASVTIPLAGRTASLKVGQSLDITSGRIEEPYSRRETLFRSGAEAFLPVAPNASNALRPLPAATRPMRENDSKEADPESGAAPAARLRNK